MVPNEDTCRRKIKAETERGRRHDRLEFLNLWSWFKREDSGFDNGTPTEEEVGRPSSGNNSIKFPSKSLEGVGKEFEPGTD